MTPFLPSLESLSLAQQVAQMMVVRTTGHLFDHEIEYPQWEANWDQLTHYIQDLGIGGVILLGGSAAEVGVRSQQLQSLAQIPLLIAADLEEGVGQRFSGATWFPPPMALGAIARRNLSQALTYAEAMGRYTAQEAAALGLNWLLAPVVDVNNNPHNPVINVRAFSDNPDRVKQLTQAFIRGAQAYPVLTSAKHFPGHGDTETDSHLALPVLTHDLARLRQVELVPFEGAIATGVDSIMTAHLLVKTLDPDYPATLSTATLTGLLRQALGFDGLIVTDALVMGAITQRYGPYEAAVLAIEAGADVVLMPADPVGAIDAICEAVRLGRLTPEHITRSLERIWRAKHKTSARPVETGPSCHAWEQPDSPHLSWNQIARPPARQLQTQILQAAMEQATPLRPLAPVTRGRNLILVDDLISCRYLSRTAPALVYPAQAGYRTQLVDCRWQVETALADRGTQPTLLQLFIRGNPFRNSASLVELAQDYIQALVGNACLQGVVFYGSPYVVQTLKLPETLPWVFSYGQMPAAQGLALARLLGSSHPGAVDGSFTD
jgi:beta-glucosidase